MLFSKISLFSLSILYGYLFFSVLRITVSIIFNLRTQNMKDFIYLFCELQVLIIIEGKHSDMPIQIYSFRCFHVVVVAGVVWWVTTQLTILFSHFMYASFAQSP